jgi:hypothetical protein
MSRKVSNQELDDLLSQYRDSGDAQLDNAIDGLINLKASGEISEELSLKIMKLLIGRHIALQMTEDIRQSDLYMPRHSERRKIKFMKFSYGKINERITVS